MFGGMTSLLSCTYMSRSYSSCRKLLVHEMDWPLDFAFAKAGRSIAAKIAMMAMTTRRSIKVKAALEQELARLFVAQICNLLCRRIAFCDVRAISKCAPLFRAKPITN